jgi:hypothetical protein
MGLMMKQILPALRGPGANLQQGYSGKLDMIIRVTLLPEISPASYGDIKFSCPRATKATSQIIG